MPLYEYSCRLCQERFEVLQRMGAGGQEIRCPECGAADVERKLSTFAAAIAGGGRSSGNAFEGCGRPQCGPGAGFT
jgi:putative FmdB family regulatory protein